MKIICNYFLITNMEIILKFIIICEKCKVEFENYLVDDCKLCISCNYTDTCESSVQKLCQNIKCKKCFERSFLSNRKSIYWNYERNNRNPREAFKCSDKKYFFICNNCKHNFESSLSNITRGNNWCSFCSHQKLCDDKECDKCFNNSFSSHEKSKFWDYVKNICTPREVFKSTAKKYIFLCSCSHNFEISPNKINSSRWCPYCCFPPQKLCNNKECNNCFNNSFSSNEKSKFWDYVKNNCNPRDVFKNSNKKYFFNCNFCKHNFKSRLCSITGQNSWCNYCGNRKLCKDIKCNSCFDKSFSSHEKSKYWNEKKNNCNPRKVFKNTHDKFWFNCEKNHSFDCGLNKINSGRWCPHCRYKTETIVFNFLTEKNYIFSRQQKFHWCKNIKTEKHFPFDFYLQDLKIILEIDGPQHFQQISNWQTPEIAQERDIYKEKLCLENGITVIRINQEDIFYEKTNWKNDLLNHLIEYSSPKIIYLCSENNYSTRN